MVSPRVILSVAKNHRIFFAAAPHPALGMDKPADTTPGTYNRNQTLLLSR